MTAEVKHLKSLGVGKILKYGQEKFGLKQTFVTELESQKDENMSKVTGVKQMI